MLISNQNGTLITDAIACYLTKKCLQSNMGKPSWHIQGETIDGDGNSFTDLAEYPNEALAMTVMEDITRQLEEGRKVVKLPVLKFERTAILLDSEEIGHIYSLLELHQDNLDSMKDLTEAWHIERAINYRLMTDFAETLDQMIKEETSDLNTLTPSDSEIPDQEGGGGPGSGVDSVAGSKEINELIQGREELEKAYMIGKQFSEMVESSPENNGKVDYDDDGGTSSAYEPTGRQTDIPSVDKIKIGVVGGKQKPVPRDVFNRLVYKRLARVSEDLIKASLELEEQKKLNEGLFKLVEALKREVQRDKEHNSNVDNE